MDQFRTVYSSLPEILTFPFLMDEANADIHVYTGNFLIRNELVEVDATGDLRFRWLPSPGVIFSGSFNQFGLKFFAQAQGENEFELMIEGLLFGKARLQHLSSKAFNESSIIGKMSDVVVRGDKSIPVEKIVFAVPNMREYHGSSVKKASDDASSMYNNRIAFQNEEYSIVIDKNWNYSALQKSLRDRGGYILQYTGEVQRRTSHILLSEMNDFLDCLNSFLSFINGRRTSAILLHGIHNDEIKWRDFTAYRVDPYDSVGSWSQIFYPDFNVIWNTFSELWKDNDNKNFLTSAIHWYLEANKNSALTEGSIIMAQTALELIYNWLLIEREGLLVGKDAENINAANKVRLLLSRINIPYDIPSTLSKLHAYLTENNDAVDAPEIIVQIRNAIVHSQIEKRKKLSAIPIKAKHEALQLCLWYIELSLLNILGYNGEYFNRCVGARFAGDGKQKVPWS